jgi:ankyrin repeat protein
MKNDQRRWRDLHELLWAISDPLVLEERSIGVNEVGSDGDRPLHIAATWGDVEAIEMLIAAGAELDVPGDLGCTPLHKAVSQQHVEATRRLLELGASPETVCEFGTARDMALRRDNPH